MLLELDLLKLLGTRSTYEEVHTTLSRDQLTEYTYQIAIDLEEYYKVNPSYTNVDWARFSEWFLLAKHRTTGTDRATIYKQVFQGLIDRDEEEDSEPILRALLERASAHKIATMAGQIFEGNDSVGMEDIKEELDEFFQREEAGVEGGFRVSDDVATLFSDAALTGGLEWRLECLNRSVGPLRRGNTVLLAARVEMGKSTFLASEVTYMASQVEEGCVLWFTNEEPGEDVKRRIICAATGKTVADVRRDPVGVMAMYEKIMGTRDKVIVWDQPRMHMGEIVKLCRRYNPKVIVCDQLRNVGGFEKKSATEVERLKKLYVEWRALAKEFGPTLTVHQAGGEAHGMLYPEATMLEGCRTEVQGALDVQIMMGVDFDNPSLRGLNIVKNKLLGGPRTDPSLRHSKHIVVIKESIARLEDV